jgi:hypothetical protein
MLGQFVEEGGVVVLRLGEESTGRYIDGIGRRTVIGSGFTMADR